MGLSFNKESHQVFFAQIFFPSFPMSRSSRSALNAKLNAALISREERRIRRRLPDPNTSPSSSSSSNNIPSLTDFTSNDYLSLCTSSHLRHLFLSKLRDAPD